MIKQEIYEGNILCKYVLPVQYQAIIWTKTGLSSTEPTDRYNHRWHFNQNVMTFRHEIEFENDIKMVVTWCIAPSDHHFDVIFKHHVGIKIHFKITWTNIFFLSKFH